MVKRVLWVSVTKACSRAERRRRLLPAGGRVHGQKHLWQRQLRGVEERHDAKRYEGANGRRPTTRRVNVALPGGELRAKRLDERQQRFTVCLHQIVVDPIKDQARLLGQVARLMNRRKHECAVRDGDPMARVALLLHGLGVQLGGCQVIELVVAPG